MKSSVLPPSMLRCLSTKDRASLGRAGLLPEEALRKQEIKSERDLQKQIVGLLRLRGIEPIVSRFGKKTTNNLGTPDIIFAAKFHHKEDKGEGWSLESWGEEAHGWEIKLPDGKSSKEQEQMAVRLSTPPNSWRYHIVRSLDEAIDLLKGISETA